MLYIFTNPIVIGVFSKNDFSRANLAHKLKRTSSDRVFSEFIRAYLQDLFRGNHGDISEARLRSNTARGDLNRTTIV